MSSSLCDADFYYISILLKKSYGVFNLKNIIFDEWIDLFSFLFDMMCLLRMVSKTVLNTMNKMNLC